MAFDEFYPWAAETFPLLYQCFGAFVYSRVCPGLGVPQVGWGWHWIGLAACVCVFRGGFGCFTREVINAY